MTIQFLVTNELVQEKQRVSDFEEGIQLLQKQLRTSQAKISEQVKNSFFFVFSSSEFLNKYHLVTRNSKFKSNKRCL